MTFTLFFHLDNDFRILTTPIHPAHLSKTPLHTLVLHPQSPSDLYSFIKGVTLLESVALHSELFPSIDRVLLVGIDSLDSIRDFIVQNVLALFPATHRPVVLFASELRGALCDRVMVRTGLWIDVQTVLHPNWHPTLFFPSMLESTLFKAGSYVYSHFYPDYRPKDAINMLIVHQRNKGAIENVEIVEAKLKERFRKQIRLETCFLQDFSVDQLIPMLGRTDLLMAITGNDLMQSIFMLPGSAVIEVDRNVPSASPYGEFVTGTGLSYLSIKANDVCHSKKKCPKKTMNLRNCTIEYEDCEKSVTEAIQLVREKKYREIFVIP